MTDEVIEIVRKYLIENEYDGLMNDNGECGCELSDLEPCGEMSSRCKAAYKHPSDEYDFVMRETK